MATKGIKEEQTAVAIQDVASGESGAVVATAALPTQVQTKPEVIAQVKQEKQAADLGYRFSEEIEQSLSEIKVIDPVAAGYIEIVRKYAEKFGTKNQTNETELRQLQASLFRVLTELPVYAGIGFNQAWGTLLAVINENKSSGKAFNEYSVYRFLHDDSLFGVEDRLVFTRMINLVLVTSDPAIRPYTAKHVNLSDTLKYKFSEEAANKIRGYYSLISA